MKTVKIIFLITICLSPLTMNGQEKELKDAIKDGSKREIFYIANPSDLTTDKYKKWADKQKDYIITSIKTDTKLRFGHALDYITEIVFIPMSQKEEYQNYLAALEREEREREDTKAVLGATGLVLAGTLMVAAATIPSGSDISFNSRGTSPSNSNSTSKGDLSNSSSNIDVEKISAPKYSLRKEDNRVKWEKQNDSWDWTFVEFVEQDSDGEWISDETLYKNKDGNYGWFWHLWSPENVYYTEKDAVDAIYVWKKYQKIRKKGKK